MPPYFLFSPLERHIDSGFGATGYAFMRSAELLANAEERMPQGRIPVAYLYRHAIELFLKSAILTVHRTLKVPFGDIASDAEPHVLVGLKWKSMYQVHGVAELFDHLKRVLVDNAAAIGLRAATPWHEIPAELEREIANVQTLDSTSTFFRYPITKQGGDAIKSTFLPVADLAQVAAGPPAITLLLVGNDDEVVEAFTSQGDPLETAIAALRAAASSLHAAHLGLRMELADGW